MENINLDYSNELMKYLESLGEVRENELMENHTSFKTGGPADILISPKSMEVVPEIVSTMNNENIPLTVIGGGTNLLVSDRGIRGVVLKIKCNKQGGVINVKDNIIYCEGGVSKEDFLNFSIDSGFNGVEFMAGIPGCMGGGIMMNAGANLGTFVDILDRIEIVDNTGRLKTVSVNKDMSSYRKFNAGMDGVVTGCYIKLPFSKCPSEVRKTVDDLLKERDEKHPLDFPSAGSVFKNPQGHSSWQLIDNAGLKEKRIGGSMVSGLHTNFIINTGNARSEDIKNLIELIQETILSKYNVALETEIRMIGEV